MTDKHILDEFGKQLILSVRDRTIEKFSKITTGSLKSPKGRELSQLLEQFDDDQIAAIRTLMIETIDNALFNFLDMIEDGENGLELLVKQKNLNEISDGLAGELLTSDGWISRFSQVK
jgi:hypothetical protein